jgi:two-component sensor histidine kinase/sensor domain CHASE-containing protein
MSIRLRTLLLIAGTTVGLLAILYTISALLFLDRFSRLERKEALRGLQQANNALANELGELDTFNHDWAAWDDTYAFVQDRDPGYLESNLMDETFVGGMLNLMVFLDREGGIVFAKSYDWRQQNSLDLPAELMAHLRPGSPLVPRTDEDAHFQGILLLPEAPLLVVSHPILTSTSRGPRHGTLIMGRYLDDAELASLAEQTRLELRLFRQDREQPRELPEDARATLGLRGELVRPLDGERIAAYSLLRDVAGETALVLRSVIPRETYRQGLLTIRYLVFSLLGVGLVFCAVVMFLLEAGVLRRVSGLSRAVAGIGSRRDLSARVGAYGRDELGALAESIDAMLVKLQQAAETHRALTDAIPDLILRVDESGRLLDANRPEDPLLEPAGGRDRGLPAAFAARSLQELRAAISSRRMRIFEHRQEAAGGARDYEARVLAIAPGEALQIIRDVTERKRSEELAKKELLLREIHHRVKNNLQVVSSLLYLQSQQVGDPRLAEILEENRNRIRSIALIHEKLYQSKDPGEVRFAAYLRDLLNNLLIAYGASAAAVRPELVVDEGEAFGLDTAILLGLLVSELVSNALKHAFPRGTGGVIRIALERIGADGLRLEVGDDGVGLPPECDPATSRSMGLMLVQLFAKQLEAVLEVERGGGTRFVFLFRRPEA